MGLHLLADTAVSTAAGGTSSSPASTAGGLSSTLLMVAYIAIFVVAIYFIIFRPQRKKQKKEEKMRKDIQMGDELVTIGGVFGKVVSLKEDSIVIETSSDRSKLRIARWAVQQNMTVHDNPAD